MMTPSHVRDALRVATDENHQALHRHGLLRPLGEGALTHADYTAALQAFELSYRHLEASLVLSVPTDLPSAPVLNWLHADMACHQVSPQLSIEMAATAIDTLSKLMGYLYVKQGSTLGGRVISKRLERALGLTPCVDNQFFGGYGDETGHQWKAFLAGLEHHAPALDAAEACAQAVASFAVIEKACDTILALRSR